MKKNLLKFIMMSQTNEKNKNEEVLFLMITDTDLIQIVNTKKK